MLLLLLFYVTERMYRKIKVFHMVIILYILLVYSIVVVFIYKFVNYCYKGGRDERIIMKKGGGEDRKRRGSKAL